jgi:hypothetical protein
MDLATIDPATLDPATCMTRTTPELMMPVPFYYPFTPLEIIQNMQVG